jgi:hypothetical protein
LVESFLDEPGVSDRGRGWGASALKVDGRIFALLSRRRDFVVKLPRARVDELVESGDGVRFDPRGGRPMKEWVAINPASTKRWSALAAEALEFVRTA